jgi:nitrate/nitrite transporter NarK
MGDAGAATGRTSGSRGLLAGTWLLSVLANAYLIVPASVMPPTMATLDTGPGLTVWLVSGAFAGWAVSNVAVGLVIDRTSDRAVATVATLGLALTGVWSWRAGLAGDVPSLLASRAVAGVAMGAVWTTGANLVGRAFAAEHQGTALGVFTTSAPVGLALGQSAGPLVDAAWGWPANYLLLGTSSLAGYALFVLAHRRTVLAPVDRSVPGLAALLGVVREPAVAYGSVLGFLAYSLFLFFNSWMPTYLTQAFSLSLATSSLFAALFPAIGVVSRAGGGLVSDRLLGGRRRPIVRLSFAASTPLVAAIALTDRLAVLVALLVAAGFTIQLSIGILYSYVREVVQATRHGTALSLLVTASITGAFTAPAITGWLIDTTGAYSAAFGFAGVLGGLGLVLAWAAPES